MRQSDGRTRPLIEMRCQIKKKSAATVPVSFKMRIRGSVRPYVRLNFGEIAKNRNKEVKNHGLASDPHHHQPKISNNYP